MVGREDARPVDANPAVLADDVTDVPQRTAPRGVRRTRYLLREAVVQHHVHDAISARRAPGRGSAFGPEPQERSRSRTPDPRSRTPDPVSPTLQFGSAVTSAADRAARRQPERAGSGTRSDATALELPRQMAPRAMGPSRPDLMGGLRPDLARAAEKGVSYIRGGARVARGSAATLLQRRAALGREGSAALAVAPS